MADQTVERISNPFYLNALMRYHWIRIACRSRSWYNPSVETITRNVGDLRANERSAAEELVGHRLREDQQLVIQVVNLDLATDESSDETQRNELPAWCNVYEGLMNERIAEIEKSIVRSPGSRMFD